MIETIHQIIPALPGWRACFVTRAGVEESHPIICWALIEEDGERFVVPMHCDTTDGLVHITGESNHVDCDWIEPPDGQSSRIVRPESQDGAASVLPKALGTND